MRLPVWARSLTARPIRRIPIRIRAGPNEGRRWSVAVSGRGISAGNFEAEKFAALAALVRPGEIVWDIGAHYGYATLIAAREAGEEGSVVAFEPSTANRWYLEQHLAWNGETRVEVMDCAVAEADRSDRFGGSGGSIAFRLGYPGEPVRVRSITSLVESGLTPPSLLKIDVEGAEALVLDGARAALEDARRRGALPTILVAVHDPELYEACRDRLGELRYRVLASRPIEEFLDGAPWRGDPDLLAVPGSRQSEMAQLREIPLFGAGREVHRREDP